jgi:endonuclease-3
MSPIMQKKVVLLPRPKTLRPKATPHQRSLLLRLLRRRNRNPAKNPVIRKTDHVRAVKIYDRLLAAYPDAKCALDFENPVQLLIATILSAQSTDKTVNTVTPALFRKFRTAEQFANADLSELEKMVHSTGFFRNKARSIQGACRIIVEDHAGKVPQEMDQLLKLPGVARKTANVVLGVAFGKAEGVVVDTHVQRLSVRLNFTMESRPDKIEEDLMKLFPREKWIHLSHLLIHHGRALCQARRPKCIECPVEDLCKSADKVMA